MISGLFNLDKEIMNFLMLKMLLIADIVSKIISLVIFVCLAM